MEDKKERLLMFRIVDTLMQNCGADAVDWMLEHLDPEDMRESAVSGLLSATWPAKSVLPNRSNFHEKSVFAGLCDSDFMRMME